MAAIGAYAYLLSLSGNTRGAAELEYTNKKFIDYWMTNGSVSIV